MQFIYILLAILAFGFLIFIHECGHYFVARRFGVTILEFSIGMGPKLISRVSKKNNIRYSLRLLPIGGFVSMAGEDSESEDTNAFCNKPVYQRILITVAGAATNIIVGIVAMIVIIGVSNTQLASNTIAELPLNEDGINYSYESGLRVDDTITKVNETTVHTGNEALYEIMHDGIHPIRLEVIRNGEKIVLENVEFPTFTEQDTVFGDIDFKVYAEEKTFGNVMKHGWFRAGSTIKMIWESLFDLISGRYSIKSVSGPIGVTKELGKAAETGAFNFFYLVVVISMNLGVVNLLPFPALDGGRLIFLLIELIARRPIPRKVEEYINLTGFILLMILMVVIVVKDVIQLF